MGVPATTGQLRTKVADMQIGDYIVCNYASATSGVLGSFSNFGGTAGTELPLTASATPNGTFYFVKTAKGLLVADRVLQHSITWDTLNNGKVAQGNPQTFDLVNGIIRSLTGGVAYANYPSKKDLVPKHTADSTSILGPSSTKYYLFDDTTTTEYAFGVNNFIGYNFGSVETINKVVMHFDNTNRQPKDFTIEGWDGSNWVVLKTVSETNQVSGTSIESRSYELTSASYSQYRIAITSVFNDTFCAIRELEFKNELANEEAVKSTSDLGYGAFPTNNEWDKYIVNFPTSKIASGKTLDDVFHWSNVFTWTQDTIDISINVSGNRAIRGYNGEGKTLSNYASSTTNTVACFRTVFQYNE